LFGHSAGGQFVARYLVLHAARVSAAVISAASTYPFPLSAVAWPFGSQDAPAHADWAAACASRTTVAVGADDTEPRPSAPGQVGDSRVERASSWVETMRQHAVQSGVVPRLELSVVPGVDHDEIRMTAHGQAALTSLWGATAD